MTDELSNHSRIGTSVFASMDWSADVVTRLSKSIQPGWAADRIYTFVDGYPLLVLRNASEKREAVWVLDSRGGLLAPSLTSMPQERRELFVASARNSVLETLKIFIEGPDAGSDKQLSDFLSLPQSFRNQLISFGSALAFEAPVMVQASVENPYQLGVIPGTSASITSRGAANALNADLMERYATACSQGRLTWPSPVDGHEVDEVRPLVLGTLLGVLRCVDRRHRLVFYIVTAGFHQQPAAIFIPALGTLFGASNRGRASGDGELPPLPRLLAEHALSHGQDLLSFLSRPVVRIAHFLWPEGGAHLGHYLWNELAGLEFLTNRVARRHQPLVFDLSGAADASFFGSLPILYPELRGRFLLRCKTIPQMLSFAYRMGIAVVRFSGDYVPAETRTRIQNAVARLPSSRAAREAAALDGPTIVFGLRVENRTLADHVSFYAELARRLSRDHPKLRIVVDGHNVRSDNEDSDTFQSYLENRAERSPIEVERGIVANLRDLLAGENVEIIDCVGATVLDNLAWLSVADFFVAPWGAGLAKYRWVCNLPGYVLASRVCQQWKKDLDIYHNPAYMERPAPIWLVPSGLVTDLPDAPVLIEMEERHRRVYVNYEVDSTAVAEEIAAILTSSLSHNGGTGAMRQSPPPIEHDVLIGREGELFLAYGSHSVIDYVLGVRKPLANSYRTFARNIESRRRTADRLGARYLHVLFPDKQSVLTERFLLNSPICLGEEYRQRCTCIWSDVLYPRQMLQQIPGGAFLRTDTHLNHHGTLGVVLEMIHRLTGVDHAHSYSQLAALISIERERAGDLGRRFDPARTEIARYLRADPTVKRFHNEDQLEGGNSSLAEILISPDALYDKRIVLFGDSFMRDAIGFLAYFFREVVFFRSAFLHEELAEATRPDFVVTSNVERYLSHVEADDERPAFHVMHALGRAPAGAQRDFAEAISGLLAADRMPHQRLLDKLLLGTI